MAVRGYLLLACAAAAPTPPSPPPPSSSATIRAPPKSEVEAFIDKNPDLIKIIDTDSNRKLSREEANRAVVRVGFEKLINVGDVFLKADISPQPDGEITIDEALAYVDAYPDEFEAMIDDFLELEQALLPLADSLGDTSKEELREAGASVSLRIETSEPMASFTGEKRKQVRLRVAKAVGVTESAVTLIFRPINAHTATLSVRASADLADISDEMLRAAAALLAAELGVPRSAVRLEATAGSVLLRGRVAADSYEDALDAQQVLQRALATANSASAFFAPVGSGAIVVIETPSVEAQTQTLVAIEATIFTPDAKARQAILSALSPAQTSDEPSSFLASQLGVPVLALELGSSTANVASEPTDADRDAIVQFGAIAGGAVLVLYVVACVVACHVTRDAATKVAKVEKGGCCTTGCCSALALRSWSAFAIFAAVLLGASLPWLAMRLSSVRGSLLCTADNVVVLSRTPSIVQPNVKALLDDMPTWLREEVLERRDLMRQLEIYFCLPAALCAALLLLLGALTIRPRAGRSMRCAACAMWLVLLLLLLVIIIAAALPALSLAADNPWLVDQLNSAFLHELNGYCNALGPALQQLAIDLAASNSSALADSVLRAEWVAETFSKTCVCANGMLPHLADVAEPSVLSLAAVLFATLVALSLRNAAGCCMGKAKAATTLRRPSLTPAREKRLSRDKFELSPLSQQAAGQAKFKTACHV